MAAKSAQREAGWFTSPGQVNHRRYEALRAFFTEGLTYEQAGAPFGYTRWAMIYLVRQHRAGKLGCSPRRGSPARRPAWRRPRTARAAG